MPSLQQVVSFDISRLFNGAVDVDWLNNDREKTLKAARSFVFHGPDYHGVSQSDISGTAHRLLDSATFFKNSLESLEQNNAEPFTIAIAGYGSGKSHLALTLAEYLQNDNEEFREAILQNIVKADPKLAEECRRLSRDLEQRVLLIVLNGMGNFDLSAELLGKAKASLLRQGISTEPLDKLRARFPAASNILKNIASEALPDLLESLNLENIEQVLEKLAGFDELTYEKVHRFLSRRGIPLSSMGDETAKDILKFLATEYVGDDKPFKKILILFDEFGRYMEFATTKSHLAGNGALQHLYEGVQENDANICFVGFIQYELRAYEQRMSSDYKNEMRRFISRFQSAKKLYLSINLETLIASLLEKSLDAKSYQSNLTGCFTQMQSWFPAIHNHSLWSDPERFRKVIGEGCYPLSPILVWVLFHLSAGGQYLQQRSALSLLNAALEANRDFKLSEQCPLLPAVRLWSEDLQHEIQEIEEQTGQGAVMQSYTSVMTRTQQHLSTNDILVLRSIVLLSICRLKAIDQEGVNLALSMFSGLEVEELNATLRNLEDELNIIAWDETFKQFDIIGDSVSRSEFIRTLNRKIEQEFDAERNEQLFVQMDESLFVEMKNPECDFAEEHKIATPEWTFAARHSYWSLFKENAEEMIRQHLFQLKFAEVAADMPRGLLIYCYVSAHEHLDEVKLQAQSLLRNIAKKNQEKQLPLILALVYDNGEIAKAMTEIAAIKNFSAEESERFGRLAQSHLLKCHKSFQENIHKSLLQRNFIVSMSQVPEQLRLKQLANHVFNAIYSKPLAFPFDGYSSYRTNAAKDCLNLIRGLLSEDYLYDKIQSYATQQRNRAEMVLNITWKIFNRDGSLAQYPRLPSARSIFEEWEKRLTDEQGLNCAQALEIACAVPYAANRASASLLFSCFIQSRRKNISLWEQGAMVEFDKIGDRLFESQAFSPKTMAGLTIFKSEGGDSEWEVFLQNWDNAQSYIEQLEFAQQANELESRIKIPRELNWKKVHLQDKVKGTKLLIDVRNREEEEACNRIERSSERLNVFELAYGGSQLNGCILKKQADPMWRSEDYENLQDRVLQAKQLLIQNFDSWLVAQRPGGRTAEALAQFKHKMLERMGRNLRNLDLDEEYEKLTKYCEKISKITDDIADCEQCLNEIGAWYDSNSKPGKDLSLSQIKERSNALKQHLEALKSQRNRMRRLEELDLAQQVDIKIDVLTALQKNYEQRENYIDEKAKGIWNSSLEPEGLELTLGELQDLERFYAGMDSDLEDFRIMRNVLESYKDTLLQLQSHSISQNDFESQLKTAGESFFKRFGEYELPWDLQESFGLLEQACRQNRSTASQKWLLEVEARLAGLSQMNTMENEALLRDLSSPPSYVDIESCSIKLENMRLMIEEHLSAKELDWLLNRFNQMKPEAQHRFLREAERLLASTQRKD